MSYVARMQRSGIREKDKPAPDSGLRPSIMVTGCLQTTFQAGFNKRVQVTIQHTLGITDFNTGA